MSQYNRENPITAPHSGAEFAADLNELLSAALSTHYGATRPEGASAGLVWARQGDILEICVFDGTDDVVIWPTVSNSTDADTLQGNDAAYFTNADNITTGTLDIDRVPDLDASKVTTGTLDIDRVPDLDASKVTTGTLDIARLPIITDTYNVTMDSNTEENFLASMSFSGDEDEDAYVSEYSLKIMRIGDMAQIDGHFVLQGFELNLPMSGNFHTYIRLTDIANLEENNWYSSRVGVLGEDDIGVANVIFGKAGATMTNGGGTIRVRSTDTSQLLHFWIYSIPSTAGFTSTEATFNFMITIKVED